MGKRRSRERRGGLPGLGPLPALRPAPADSRLFTQPGALSTAWPGRGGSQARWLRPSWQLAPGKGPGRASEPCEGRAGALLGQSHSRLKPQRPQLPPPREPPRTAEQQGPGEGKVSNEGPSPLLLGARKPRREEALRAGTACCASGGWAFIAQNRPVPSSQASAQLVPKMLQLLWAPTPDQACLEWLLSTEAHRPGQHPRSGPARTGEQRGQSSLHPEGPTDQPTASYPALRASPPHGNFSRRSSPPSPPMTSCLVDWACVHSGTMGLALSFSAVKWETGQATRDTRHWALLAPSSGEESALKEQPWTGQWILARAVSRHRHDTARGPQVACPTMAELESSRISP
ncbi:uncharacterized protein LOC143656381 isoform X2 [Tamandua tetradactyla]|uniref:uncharacterized protein LOC143656381 isoform X2 n=1 Tax=Tamandua tetradactyla TaxID=48850 RepID=UPI0040548DC6